MPLINLVSDLHKSTQRNYLARMTYDKVACMKVARRFDHDYWDGERRYGYGGYYYDGRWKPVAEKIVKQYGLTTYSNVLDIGCGKGFLAYDIQKAASCWMTGYDISNYALKRSAIDTVFNYDIRGKSIYRHYDLILCINVLHNFVLPDLKHAIQEIQRSASQAYICVDSYRNEQELFNLQCWSLTAEQFLRPEEWTFLFNEWGYTGDYEFIFFE